MKKLLFFLLLVSSLVCKASAPLDTSFHALQIVMNIPDLVKGNTTIKRKAQLKSMFYNPCDSVLNLVWAVKHYSEDDNGNYGDYLGAFIPDFIKPTTADNTVMVNTSTGAFVYKDSNGNYPNVLYIGQFNFFQRLAQYQPIIVNNLILQYGQATNWSE
jgi:hypothetical protein